MPSISNKFKADKNFQGFSTTGRLRTISHLTPIPQTSTKICTLLVLLILLQVAELERELGEQEVARDRLQGLQEVQGARLVSIGYKELS